MLDVSKLLHEYCKQEIEDMKKELEQKIELKINTNDLGFDGKSSGLGSFIR